jgi:hypothetical protein
MKTLLLCVALLMPTGCSGTSPPARTPTTDVCAIPTIAPAPELHPTNGCLPQDEVVALALWIARVAETQRALAGCSLVKLTDR